MLQLCFSFSELRLVPALLAHSTVLIIHADPLQCRTLPTDAETRVPLV